MNKEETNKILNDDLIEKEIIQLKRNKKLIITISIAFSLFIITSATLLVGYFIFDWFQSDIYNIDVKISRNVYQANYFTEIKTLKTKTLFVNNTSESSLKKIYTDFVVLLTERKKIEKDLLNNATLVILDTKINTGDGLKEFTSFDIYNEAKIKEFKSNPDGSKYPISVFSFYENGTINEIQIPNNTNKYYANEITELIESIIPKLTRNKTEDISNGLTIKVKKDKMKKTLIESISPRENEYLRDSKFVKTVERDFENDKLTNIRISSHLDLMSIPHGDEVVFGIKHFSYEQKSEIVSTGLKEEKENAELLKELTKYYTFVNSKNIIQTEKKKEIWKEKEEEEIIINEWKKDINSTKLRKLGFSICPGVHIVDVKTINVNGVSVKIKVKIGCSWEGAVLQIIFSSNNGDYSDAYFGIDGVKDYFSKVFTTPQICIFSVKYPPIPGVEVALVGTGRLNIKIYEESEWLIFRLSGFLDSSLIVVDGWQEVTSISQGAMGDILNADIIGKIRSDGSFGHDGVISGGPVTAFASGYDLDRNFYNKEWIIWEKWSTYF